MIFICNFYAHQKEAVSNQIELLRNHTDGHLFAAGIFLNQPHLAHNDISQKRIVLTETEFERALPHYIKSLPIYESIHYFSEEPEKDKVKIFNSVENSLYISMYRRPTKTYATFLKKFKHLVRIYVEHASHKSILVRYGIDPMMVVVALPPSLFKRKYIKHKFSGKFLFASWNGGDKTSLLDRGLVAILDFLESNHGATCNVLLRDQDTALYTKMIQQRQLTKRISLSNIDTFSELRRSFAETDVVLFLTQKKVTKDIPNSVIDGLSLGKPALVTDTIDLAKDVINCDLGWVIKPGETIDLATIKHGYAQKSRCAFNYSKNMTSASYIKSVLTSYRSI